MVVCSYALRMMMFGSMLATVAGCSSKPIVRSKDSDFSMRVMADPRAFDVQNFVQLEAALAASQKFELVERRDALETALDEQRREFDLASQGHFSDSEKYARRGKLYGVDTIVSGRTDCYQAKAFWSGVYTRYCRQTLLWIEGSTGRVLFSVTGENSVPWTAEYIVPDYKDTVQAAIDALPKYFTPHEVHPILETYKQQSAENAKRERENELQAQVPRKPSSSANIKPAGVSEASKDFQLMREKAIQMQQQQEVEGE